MIVDWNSTESTMLLNPAYSAEEKKHFYTLLDSTRHITETIWVATSGSSVSKWVGLSKQAVLASARAVNLHLESDSTDRWAHALPDFHVGGLGIWARARSNGAAVYDYKKEMIGKWDPHHFCACVQKYKATLTALVPAQVHDFAQLKLQSPSSLRAVIIGGGRLSENTYSQAIELGWKLLPSYGMTECASQIATAELYSWQTPSYPALKILPHLAVRANPSGQLCFKGSPLLSYYAYFKEDRWVIEDPKKEGWFESGDRGQVEASFLTLHGRLDQLVKVGGESVDLARLEKILESFKNQSSLACDMSLVAYPDARLGSVIHLAVTSCSIDSLNLLLEQFNQRVLPFERIRQVHHVAKIPKSSLSKVLKGELLNLIRRV